MKTTLQTPSLVGRTAALLRGKIAKGTWIGCLPGERALSEQLNLSRDTLRAALAQLHNEGRIAISHGRMTRILSAARRLRRKGASRAICVLSSWDLHRESISSIGWIAQRLMMALRDSGYHLEFHAGRHYFSRDSVQVVAGLVERVPSACWVLVAANIGVQQWFSHNQIPAVILGSSHSGVSLPSVDRDYEAACQHAARMFVAHGHRHIGFVLQKSVMAGDDISRQSFLTACEQSPQSGSLKVSIIQHDATMTGIGQALEKYARYHGCPTGLFVANAAHTLAVVTHLARLGLTIPRDFSVISRDYDYFFDLISPRLACYRWNNSIHARQLHRVVMRIVQGQRLRNRLIRVPPHFQRGESIRALDGRPPAAAGAFSQPGTSKPFGSERRNTPGRRPP